MAGISRRNGRLVRRMAARAERSLIGRIRERPGRTHPALGRPELLGFGDMGTIPTAAADLLANYQPVDDVEARDLARTRTLVELSPDPWSRAGALHLTASALVVHPETRRVLLRWHEKLAGWMQVGG